MHASYTRHGELCACQPACREQVRPSNSNRKQCYGAAAMKCTPTLADYGPARQTLSIRKLLPWQPPRTRKFVPCSGGRYQNLDEFLQRVLQQAWNYPSEEWGRKYSSLAAAAFTCPQLHLTGSHSCWIHLSLTSSLHGHTVLSFTCPSWHSMSYVHIVRI